MSIDPKVLPRMDAAQSRAYRRSVAAETIGKGVILFLLIAGSIAFVLPFWVSLMMSLKTPGEIGTTLPWTPPSQATLDNYREVLTNPNASFVLFFRNTLIITTLATTGVLIGSSIVAYAFARVRFVGRDRLFIVLLSTMMLPAAVMLIPSFVVFAKMGWVNTWNPLWVPAWFGGGAFNIFLLRQFFMSIPRELDEAAILDGAGHWTIFSKVIIPLSGPALATVGIFAVMYNWRDFLGPLIYINETDLQTLEVGLRVYSSLRAQQWHLIMAGSVLVMIPLIAIFFIGQRYFVKGIVMSGLK